MRRPNNAKFFGLQEQLLNHRIQTKSGRATQPRKLWPEHGGRNGATRGSLITGCAVVDKAVSALQAGSLRYSRLETCATSERNCRSLSMAYMVVSWKDCRSSKPRRISQPGEIAKLLKRHSYDPSLDQRTRVAPLTRPKNTAIHPPLHNHPCPHWIP